MELRCVSLVVNWSIVHVSNTRRQLCLDEGAASLTAARRKLDINDITLVYYMQRYVDGYMMKYMCCAHR